MIDIVLPVHNALTFTKECVRTIYEHTPQDRFRFIIVDDYSDVETREWLYGPECMGRTQENLYVRTGKQKWFTRASNLGLRLVRTPRAVLINSDCVVNDGWLDELEGVWEEFERTTGRRAGLVGHHQNVETPLRFEEAREPGYVTGHCLLLDMGVLAAVAAARGTPGVFLDETRQDAAHINSDRYLSYEMGRNGYAPVVSYKAQVGHHGFKSWGADLGRVFSLRLQDLD